MDGAIQRKSKRASDESAPSLLSGLNPPPRSAPLVSSPATKSSAEAGQLKIRQAPPGGNDRLRQHQPPQPHPLQHPGNGWQQQRHQRHTDAMNRPPPPSQTGGGQAMAVPIAQTGHPPSQTAAPLTGPPSQMMAPPLTYAVPSTSQVAGYSSSQQQHRPPPLSDTQRKALRHLDTLAELVSSKMTTERTKILRVNILDPAGGGSSGKDFKRLRETQQGNVDLFGSFITNEENQFDFFDQEAFTGNIIVTPLPSRIPIFPEEFPPNGLKEWPLKWWGIHEPSRMMMDSHEKIARAEGFPIRKRGKPRMKKSGHGGKDRRGGTSKRRDLISDSTKRDSHVEAVDPRVADSRKRNRGGTFESSHAMAGGSTQTKEFPDHRKKTGRDMGPRVWDEVETRGGAFDNGGRQGREDRGLGGGNYRNAERDGHYRQRDKGNDHKGTGHMKDLERPYDQRKRERSSDSRHRNEHNSKRYRKHEERSRGNGGGHEAEIRSNGHWHDDRGIHKKSHHNESGHREDSRRTESRENNPRYEGHDSPESHRDNSNYVNRREKSRCYEGPGRPAESRERAEPYDHPQEIIERDGKNRNRESRRDKDNYHSEGHLEDTCNRYPEESRQGIGNVGPEQRHQDERDRFSLSAERKDVENEKQGMQEENEVGALKEHIRRGRSSDSRHSSRSHRRHSERSRHDHERSDRNPDRNPMDDGHTMKHVDRHREDRGSPNGEGHHAEHRDRSHRSSRPSDRRRDRSHHRSRERNDRSHRHHSDSGHYEHQEKGSRRRDDEIWGEGERTDGGDRHRDERATRR